MQRKGQKHDVMARTHVTARAQQNKKTYKDFDTKIALGCEKMKG